MRHDRHAIFFMGCFWKMEGPFTPGKFLYFVSFSTFQSQPTQCMDLNWVVDPRRESSQTFVFLYKSFFVCQMTAILLCGFVAELHSRCHVIRTLNCGTASLVVCSLFFTCPRFYQLVAGILLHLVYRKIMPKDIYRELCPGRQHI